MRKGPELVPTCQPLPFQRANLSSNCYMGVDIGLNRVLKGLYRGLYKGSIGINCQP